VLTARNSSICARPRAGRERYQRFKWPERLQVVPELPMTKVGKMDMKALLTGIAPRLARD
jgi:non-ribosomal peptide synthetase component E (peptide arylation enzyme)